MFGLSSFFLSLQKQELFWFVYVQFNLSLVENELNLNEILLENIDHFYA